MIMLGIEFLSAIPLLGANRSNEAPDRATGHAFGVLLKLNRKAMVASI